MFQLSSCQSRLKLKNYDHCSLCLFLPVKYTTTTDIDASPQHDTTIAMPESSHSVIWPESLTISSPNTGFVSFHWKTFGFLFKQLSILPMPQSFSIETWKSWSAPFWVHVSQQRFDLGCSWMSSELFESRWLKLQHSWVFQQGESSETYTLKLALNRTLQIKISSWNIPKPLTHVYSRQETSLNE